METFVKRASNGEVKIVTVAGDRAVVSVAQLGAEPTGDEIAKAAIWHCADLEPFGAPISYQGIVQYELREVL